MTFVPDQDPDTIEWARTPPAHMLEALETVYLLWQGYIEMLLGEPANTAFGWARTAYQTAYNVMLRAFTEEYAP